MIINKCVPLPFPFWMERTLYVFLPDGIFLPSDHGLDFDISLLFEKSIKISKIGRKSFYVCTVIDSSVAGSIDATFRRVVSNDFVLWTCYTYLKKNQNTPRPSEHPPVMGEKMSKRLGGIKRLQIQNLFMAFKQVPMQITLGPQYNVGEKPTVILYIYINRHAGTPEKTLKANQRQRSTPSHMVVVIYITKAIITKPLHDI